MTLLTAEPFRRELERQTPGDGLARRFGLAVHDVLLRRPTLGWVGTGRFNMFGFGEVRPMFVDTSPERPGWWADVNDFAAPLGMDREELRGHWYAASPEHSDALNWVDPENGELRTCELLNADLGVRLLLAGPRGVEARRRGASYPMRWCLHVEGWEQLACDTGCYTEWPAQRAASMPSTWG